MISKEISKALESIGIKKLSKLQGESAKKILAGKDLLIIAPTGSGKTEAAIIPLLNKMIQDRAEEIREVTVTTRTQGKGAKTKGIKGITLLYITPLRALNRDMLRRLEAISKKLGLTTAVRHGDTSNSERRKQSLKPPQIMVTTPETLQILFLGKRLRESLKNIKYVVIDEVHELADGERGVQLSIALERLKKYSNFQIIGLSATIKDPEKIASFIGKNVEVVVSKETKEYSLSVIKPQTRKEDEDLAEKLFIDEEVASQLRTIKEIVESHKSTLIFVNTRQTAEALGIKLKKIIDIEVHHGSLSKESRIESEARFSSGELKALICTSSMELGIDVGHVDAVVQFNSPRQVNRLIQRVGRSGHRTDRISKGYIITGSFDDVLESIVISDMAEKRIVEDSNIHYLSLDTLANQITAILLEKGRMEVNEVFELMRSAYPYKNMEFKKFIEICNFLKDINIIFFDDDTLSPGRKTRNYFYDNISMIPDEKNYRVFDITTGKSIGVVDESFLSTFEGELFAIKGELWKIITIEEDSVKVEPVMGDGEIPSWSGEEIPVPYEVAQRVGALRASISDELDKSGRDKTINLLTKKFNVNREVCVEVVDTIKEQKAKGFEVPTDKKITIESTDRVTILNVCYGHKVNETIGRILALLLSARKGTNVNLEVNPYRIKLSPAKAEEVKEVLFSIDEKSVRWLAERSLIDTKLLQWKVINSARKFGYLRKDYNLSKLNLKTFVIKLKETPIWEEAIREIFVEKMDVKRAEEILKGKSDLKISLYNSLSPISTSSREHASDLLIPAKPTSAVLRIFKNRLENEKCFLNCINCNYTIRTPIKLIDEKELICPRCSSRLLACINSRRKLEEYSKQEIFKNANLVMANGKKAIYALNTHGVGVESAGRILSKFYPDENSFFLKLLEAEKQYIRTRRFWDY